MFSTSSRMQEEALRFAAARLIAALPIAALFLAACVILLAPVPVIAQPSLPDLLGLRPLMNMPAMQSRSADPDSASGAAAFGTLVFLAPESDAVDELALTDEAVRGVALRWAEDYAARQALFDPADVNQLRQRLSTLPVGTVQRWLQSSQELRDRLDEEDWRTTQRWLNQFLAAQAIYTEQQLSQFRQRLADRTPTELMVVMDHFTDVRALRQQRQAVSEQQRRMALANARRMQAAQPIKPAATLQGQSVARYPGYPTVNAGDNTRVPRRRPFPYTSRSLSQRVADIYVYRSVFGNDAVWAWWGLGGL